MKVNTLWIVACCVSCYSFSQQNTVTSGGDASGAGGSYSYSIGQVDYINNSGSNGNVHEGVQQPYEFFNEVGLDEEFLVVTNIYPNPSTDIIVVETDESRTDLEYMIYDANGKVLGSGEITSSKTEIDVSSFATGQYILKISNTQKIIESIKIIKH